MQPGQVVVGPGIVGIEANGFAVILDSATVVTLIVPSQAAIVIG